MTIIMIVLLVVVLTLLLVVAGISPRRDVISAFELERRKSQGDAHAMAAARRTRLLADVLSLQRVLLALLLVVFVLFSVVVFGWVMGILVAVFVALEYGTMARFAQAYSQPLYEKYEPALLDFIEKHAGFFRLLRSVTPEKQPDAHLQSREELLHLVESSGTLLSSDEKKLISHGLGFGMRQVSEIMTPRGVIDSIGKKELLGPLVLNDLHKTGHSRFPVQDGDIDHIVGILHVRDMLTLDTKKQSATVEKAMEPRVFYIREDQPLHHALAAFLRTRHHLFVVVNEFRETVGIVTLEDVLEALLGRKITDEFDAHEDLRAVAERNPRGNNQPEGRKDV